jgi:DNA polymerase-3 subunit alpha
VRTGVQWKISQRERGCRDLYIRHPLDDYKFEMKYFCNAKLNTEKFRASGKNLTFGGIINNAAQGS